MAQPTHETTLDLPVLLREAVFVPKSVNEEERTAELVWTTGAPVKRGFFEQYWEELSLDPKHVRLKRLNNGAPLLKDHRGDVANAIGVVVSARIENGKGIATVRFAKAEDDPVADQIFRKVKDGILQNISVGYQVHKMEEREAGKDKLPRYMAVDWEPYEISVVAMGADDGAGFRSATDSPRNPCVFVTRQQEQTNMPTPPKTEDQNPAPAPSGESAAVAATRAATMARIENAKQQAEALAQEREAAIAEERVRSAEIRKIASQAQLGEEWALKLIEAGTPVDEARKAAFTAMTRRDGEVEIDGYVRIGAGEDERDKRQRAAMSWLIERTGKRKLLEQAKQKAPDLFAGIEFGSGNQFRGMSPIELARDFLEHAGVKTRGMDKMRMLGLAFTHRSGGYQSTSDFATLLENTLHKFLLGAYETQETTWERFCGTDDVPDFRPSNRYRTGSLPSLPKVAEHEEYKNGQIPDAAKFQISTERHGEIFSLSREVLVNDDMGALANLAMEFGRAAARTIENDVFALIAENGGLGPTMADAQPFFHANRANVNAVASALTVGGLDADRVIMRAQKDPSGRDFLSLSPAVLLVPDSSYSTARVLNESARDPDANNKLERKNAVFGLFRDIVGTPRLAAGSTRRYLFTDPSICAAIVVAYLEGYGRGPIMESQNGWRTDGVEWKVTQYAKAQAGDPKGAVTNAGT